MIDTNTTWRETAYDCEHCGGIILKRVDHETGQPVRICHQCGQCGCQWSLSGELLRVGNSRQCRLASQQNEAGQILDQLPTIPRNVWLYLVLAFVAFLFLARFGMLGAVFRLAIPLVVVALIAWLIWQTVKDRQ